MDLVADVRASTPSVAAEIAVKERKEKFLDIQSKWDKVNLLLNKKLERLTSIIFNVKEEISNLIEEKISKNKLQIVSLKSEVVYLLKEKLLKAEHKIESFNYKVSALNPAFALNKGYALIEKNGVKAKAENIFVNDVVDLRLKNKIIKAKILKVENEI